MVARTDRIVVDRVSQCADYGEVSHTVNSKRIEQSQLIELGLIFDDPDRGRTSGDQITIAYLTGIAAQDIAIANAVLNSL